MFMSASLFVLCIAAPVVAFAQTAPATPAPNADTVEEVVVTGQRAALQSAQKLKQNAEEVVDSIVADDIGKLPDRSVTEALQRVVGVTIDHTMARGDPEHYSVEGSGVNIRGLTYVRSELNGRDSFTANGGRSLSFEDVPPELMAGVDIYKNPSAQQIEGAIGGLVNLRTQMPFDHKGFTASVSAQGSYGELSGGKATPSGSILLSDRWDTNWGQFGALVDVAYSESKTRTDGIQVEPYYQRIYQNNSLVVNPTAAQIASGQKVWIPKGVNWRTLEFDRKRFGTYGALQWRPNDKIDMSLTYFRSQYKMDWSEYAIFSQANVWNIEGSNLKFDGNGVLQSGTLSDSTDGGINFNDDVRAANRKSVTADTAYHIRWEATDRLTIQSDLQYVRATTNSFDSTVATGLLVPSEQIDLTGKVPTVKTDNTYLANKNNYYWGFTMDQQGKSLAHEWAWKTDADYRFDNDILRSLSVGVRFSDRDSINDQAPYNWSAVSQPWMLGWQIPTLAYLSDPRFQAATTLHSFDNFFNGQADTPASVIFPDASLATGFPASYEKLHSFHDILCAQMGSTCDKWAPSQFGSDAYRNVQDEKSYAAYTQLRFGFDDLKYPIDGNVGVRAVKTVLHARGVTVLSASTLNGTPVTPLPIFTASSNKQSFQNDYTNVLPSLNLRMKISPEFQVRFAAAKAIARPDFSQLQAYTTLTPNYVTSGTDITGTNLTGTASGNPYLTPTKSDQYDVSAEWYFAKAGSLTFAGFYKHLSDVVINQVSTIRAADTTGTLQNFTTTSPVNGARGLARGFEVAYQQYFDFLPGLLSGFGVQANYTYVDSRQHLYNPVTAAYCTDGSSGATNLNLNLNGCDTNGQTFGNLPLANLSKNSYNLALLYDKGPVSARLAYNWRSKYLQAVNVNGTQGTDGGVGSNQSIAWGLPTWADDYGQLDGSIFYKVNEKVTVGLEAQNLTDSIYKQLMQQHSGMMGRAWFASGPRYTLQLRATF
jgi:TonB-dependent receptor